MKTVLTFRAAKTALAPYIHPHWRLEYRRARGWDALAQLRLNGNPPGGVWYGVKEMAAGARRVYVTADRLAPDWRPCCRR